MARFSRRAISSQGFDNAAHGETCWVRSLQITKEDAAKTWEKAADKAYLEKTTELVFDERAE
jgi:hypothetical protein